MLCFPNAKINIGLNVTEKRSDGFHNIETVFCPVGLTDILECVLLPGSSPGGYRYTSTGIRVEGRDEDNLCIRAHHLLSVDFRLPAVDIYLHKLIPMGAGLGGGSSDAAYMLKNLNMLFDLNLSDDRLSAYASELGSDCAFFIKNKPLFGYGRGNRFKEIGKFPTGLEALIVHPGIHAGTAEAYSGVTPRKPYRSLEELIIQPVTSWRDTICNDFEDNLIRRHPVIGDIKDKLYQLGAVYASLTGSGSAVYGLFTGKAPAAGARFPGFFCWSGPLG